jgi:uncharacterized RDD family membrane protein YckC
MKITDGVYFLHEDYASFWLRVLIDVRDALAVGAAWSVVVIVLFTTFPFNRMTLNLTLAILAVVAFYYLIVLKRSKIGTVGYRIGGVRIVGLDGQTASLSALTSRMLLVPLGPLIWFLDLAWLSGDKHRQTLRDKLARTYVVKANAVPVGTGKIIVRYYEILFFHLLFQEIEVPTTTTADALPGSANFNE